MKKTFIMAAALAIAATFASCEKEPTALELESLTGEVIVKGYVKFTYYEKDGSTLKAVANKAVASKEIVVLRGMDTDDTPGADAWTEYKVTTDDKGFYEINLPCELGKQIDEVKIQCILSHKTACYDEDANVVSDVDADFFGEAILAPAAEGNIYEKDVDVAWKVLHGNNGYIIM